MTVAITQALSVICPNCGSVWDKSCTQPTDTGRRAVPWVHLAREAEYLDSREAAAPLT